MSWKFLENVNHLNKNKLCKNENTIKETLAEFGRDRVKQHASIDQ